MALTVDLDKLREGLKNIKDASKQYNEKHMQYRRILAQIEAEEVDYDSFSLQDVIDLLDIYIDEDTPEIEQGLAGFAYLKKSFQEIAKTSKGGQNVEFI